MEYFVELTNGQVTKKVKRGRSYKNTSFGKNAPDTVYTDLGLYKEIRVSPTLGINQRYGNEIITIDDVNKTYTISKEVIDLTQIEIDDRENEETKKQLLQIDLESIGIIREYIASLPDAPKIIKDKEKEASDLKIKIKP